ncbi:MAG: zinc-regulated TonB-dependent outer membrane receptor [Deltaproteobacteria bacterium]|nr:MAG: zinc-regulated TonB-dependent outer membrane receptor [Deltaproteobacteria bacterium]
MRLPPWFVSLTSIVLICLTLRTPPASAAEAGPPRDAPSPAPDGAGSNASPEADGGEADAAGGETGRSERRVESGEGRSDTPDANDNDDAAALEEIEAALAADASEREAAGASQTNATASFAGQVGRSIQTTLNPDISFIGDFALAAFSDEPMQTGAHDPKHNGFTLQQVEMAVGASVDPYFRLDGNMVFLAAGVEVEEFYATTLALPWNLQMRIGKFLSRLGRINATHPHTWTFTDQPLAIGKFFGPEGNGGLGLEASWLSPLPWWLEVVGSVHRATGPSFLGEDAPPPRSPLDLQWSLVVEQFFPLSDHWSLLFGLGAANGPLATGAHNRTDVYVADLYLKWRPITAPGDLRQLSLQAEWLLRRRQVPDDVLTDTGGYAYAEWRFDRWWAAGLRAEWVSGVPDDPTAPEWIGPRLRSDGVVSFYPTEFSRLRIQVGLDDPSWTDAPIWRVFLTTEFAIGAHGAHTF